MEFTAPLAIGLTVILLFVGINLRRSTPSKYQGDLAPNCLISKYPVVFVSGKKSLVYFLNYWNLLPSFLAEHGYEIYNLSLPWKNSQQRQYHITSQLLQIPQKAHIVADGPTTQEICKLLNNSEVSEKIESLTSLVPPKVDVYDSKTLKALPVPIETLEIPKQVTTPWWWHLHLLLTRQPSNLVHPQCLGFQSEIAHKLILDRSIFLAERDHAKNS